MSLNENSITIGITGASSIENVVYNHKYLVHEGSKDGVYYRGQSYISGNGNFVDISDKFVEISLPNYIDKIDQEFTVQLAPIYNGKLYPRTLQSTLVKNGKFLVYGCTGPFFWVVYT